MLPWQASWEMSPRTNLDTFFSDRTRTPLTGVMKARWQSEELLKVKRVACCLLPSKPNACENTYIAARQARPPRLVMEARSSY